MKFKYGDIAIYEDGFASYTGKVLTHRYRRRWQNFFFKESWYEISISDINGEPAQGIFYCPEHLMKRPEKDGKITTLRPK